MTSQNIERFIRTAQYASILLMAFAAPISIAATQTAWALSLLFWLATLFYGRPSFRREGMTFAILAFVGLTLLSSLLSYEPEPSIRKMVSVWLVSIIYLVYAAMTSLNRVRTVAGVLIAGAAIACIYTTANTVVGRNLKVTQLSAESPLRSAGVLENDTIISANGIKVHSPSDLASAVGSDPAKLKVYRYEIYFDYDLPATATNIDSEARFGIVNWSRGRDVRASGFFGHYTTFAEAMQLVGSLALGIFIFGYAAAGNKIRLVLAGAIAIISIGLFLSVTRASWAGFALSAGVMVFFATSKRTILICAAIALPLLAAGGFYLQQKRNVSFVDAKDNSTTWRLTVWREASQILVSSPRHLAVGVGMESLKERWREWGMFEGGELPVGHLHSTPLQLAFERGVPVLVAWLAWMSMYLALLWRGFRNASLSVWERGILLGSFGGTIGFLASGLVHYNWGDSEVVMIFYVLSGLALAICGANETDPDTAAAA